MLDPDLPTDEVLAPWLKKLDAHPGAAVIITIEHLPHQNWPHVGVGWLSREERRRVRKALLEIVRQRKNEP